MGERGLARRWVFVFVLVMVAAFSVFGIAVAHAADGDDETAVTFYPSDGFVRMDGVSLSNTRVAVQRGECVSFEDFPDMSGELTYTPGRNYWGGSRVHISFEGWNDGGTLPAILEPGETAIGNTVDGTTPIDPPSYMSSARARAVYTYADAVVLTVTAYGRGAGGGAADYTYHFDRGHTIAGDNPENFIRSFVSWGTDGWSGVYLDSGFAEPFDLSTPLTADTHLYFGPAPIVTRTVTFHGTTGGDADVSVADGEALDAADIPDAASVDNATFAGWSASEVWPYRSGASDWEGDTFDLSAPVTGDAELWPVYAADGFTVHVGYYDGDTDMSSFVERFVPRGYVIADDAELVDAATLAGKALVGWFDNWYEFSTDSRLTEAAPGRYAPTHRVDVTEPVASSGYYVAVYGSLKVRDLPVIPVTPPTPVYDYVSVSFYAGDGHIARDGEVMAAGDALGRVSVIRGNRVSPGSFPDMSGAYTLPRSADVGLDPVALTFSGWNDGGTVAVVDYGGGVGGNDVDATTRIDRAVGLRAVYAADCVTLTVTVGTGDGGTADYDYLVNRGTVIGSDNGRFLGYFKALGDGADTVYDGADAATASPFDLDSPLVSDSHVYFAAAASDSQPGDGGGNDDGNGDSGDDRDGNGDTGNQGGTSDGDGSDDGGATSEDGNDGGGSDDAPGDGEGDGKADAGDGGTGTLDSQDGGKAETPTGTIPDGVYKDVKEAIEATGAAFPPMAKPAATVTRLPQTGDEGLALALALVLVALCAGLLAAYAKRRGDGC